MPHPLRTRMGGHRAGLAGRVLLQQCVRLPDEREFAALCVPGLLSVGLTRRRLR